MKKGMDISPNKVDELTNNRVVKVEENNEVAKKGHGVIFLAATSALALSIILCSKACSLNDATQEKKSENKTTNEISITSDVVGNINANNYTTTETAVKKDNNEDDSREIDYTNVTTFYNHIIENRNKYGSFADSFQSEEDVKNFINFLHKFDEMYDDIDTITNLNSQEMYDKIIQDYYGSCVKYDVKGELNLLFSDNKLAQEKINEAETLAYDLKNGKGKDYTIANRYYTWMLVNLIDDRTRVDVNTNNAPFIDALREQFEQYRYSGNMLEARKYQKNDSLPVDSIHIYYADEAPEGVEITEVENSLTCPDWGVDNVISKYEENTETKLYIKRDGQGTYYRVDEAFETVLNKGKVR